MTVRYGRPGLPLSRAFAGGGAAAALRTALRTAPPSGSNPARPAAGASDGALAGLGGPTRLPCTRHAPDVPPAARAHPESSPCPSPRSASDHHARRPSPPRPGFCPIAPPVLVSACRGRWRPSEAVGVPPRRPPRSAGFWPARLSAHFRRIAALPVLQGRVRRARRPGRATGRGSSARDATAVSTPGRLPTAQRACRHGP